MFDTYAQIFEKRAGEYHHVDQHQGLNRGIIVGEVALGQTFAGIDDAVGTADLDPEIIGRRRVALFLGCLRKFLGLFQDDLRCRLVLAERDEARMAQCALGSEFGEGDFANQAGLDPMRGAAGGARNLQRWLLDFKRSHPVTEILDHFRVEARADLAGIAELAAVAGGEMK